MNSIPKSSPQTPPPIAPEVPVTPEPAPPEHTSPEPPANAEQFVYFLCDACNQEIEAPADMVGLQAECPACNAPVVVTFGEPAESDEAYSQGAAKPHVQSTDEDAEGEEDQSEMDKILFAAMKKRTIRIELPEADPIQTQRKKKFIFKRPKSD